ncbi:hypothetical protein GW17_00054623 [Ensete ventricosum]|nr:hypothetical protein GW17_00054623 [Ensete ventricosum]
MTMNLKEGADDSTGAKFDIRSDYHEVHLYYLDFVFDCSVYAGQYVTFPAPVVVAHLVDGQMSIGCHAGGRAGRHAGRHAKDLGTIVKVPRRNASHMCAMTGVIDGREGLVPLLQLPGAEQLHGFGLFNVDDEGLEAITVAPSVINDGKEKLVLTLHCTS